MKKLVSICLLAFLALAAPAWAGNLDDLASGFMGAQWGAPMPADMAGDKERIGDMLRLTQHNVELGGLKVEQIQFFFYNGKFTQAIIVHKDLDALASALTAVYGPPQVSDNPNEPGMKNWRVDLGNESLEYVTIGILPARQAAIVLHSGYLMRMLEGVNNR